jgi:hypothetical protein
LAALGRGRGQKGAKRVELAGRAATGVAAPTALDPSFIFDSSDDEDDDDVDGNGGDSNWVDPTLDAEFSGGSKDDTGGLLGGDPTVAVADPMLSDAATETAENLLESATMPVANETLEYGQDYYEDPFEASLTARDDVSIGYDTMEVAREGLDIDATEASADYDAYADAYAIDEDENHQEDIDDGDEGTMDALFAAAFGAAAPLTVKKVAKDAPVFSWYDQEEGGQAVPDPGGSEADWSFDEIQRQRNSLPAYRERKNIIRAVATNPTVVISGETGCGKTTQVPQFILEHCDAVGTTCSIICTQPRRISAMSVAERVASERGEDIGRTVGYSIRLESKCSHATRLMFCTTGILLRRLEEDPYLDGVSHVIVDEVTPGVSL